MLGRARERANDATQKTIAQIIDNQNHKMKKPLEYNGVSEWTPKKTIYGLTTHIIIKPLIIKSWRPRKKRKDNQRSSFVVVVVNHH